MSGRDICKEFIARRQQSMQARGSNLALKLSADTGASVAPQK